MRIKTMAALAAGITLAGLGLATPAMAVPSCGSGYICFYDAPDGSTLLAKVAASSYSRSVCYTSASKIPPGTSYIVNNPDSSAFVVSNASNCGPTTGPIYANSYGPMNSTFSNHIKGIFKA
jgi:hypothetical protein